MKTLLIGLFVLGSLSSFASDSFSLKCMRADGGESPIITYSSYSDDQIVLNDGSDVGWGDEVIDAYADIKNGMIVVEGLVSATISLGLTDGVNQNVDFIFNLSHSNNYLRSWLDDNSDLLTSANSNNGSKTFKFNCKVFKY